ncbi:SGNH/GDSL hydrolase family protein [Bifidobacterium tibiigranuli]|jgi:hypothetical protein|uniref:SGNH/GDSL hydrolase family protein n=1 Tax=Bifidobacterium tibiigranuli TaxID=2172043 RepID=UPI0023562360|nr:SGNH/GDSL hydrolase family protein [Bifidobacterium tibiigranuli]MCI1210997.1 SGNH/GDSL hydrolase family protein [Bifidobacterium tibiigranuli]MCI1220435.1 SGNH/GDSL hydrolase family protein [Bifidobacterium tibiigranuli]
MTDQIIDRKQVFLPGPIGETGPAGPVNPDSAPADQAVAAWVNADSSATHAALQDLLGRAGRTLVAFGDSYGRGYLTGSADTAPADRTIGGIIARRYGMGFSNYSVSGAGWLASGGLNVNTQLDTAMADSSVDRSRVAYVLMTAGRNDHASVDAGTYAATAARLLSMYPNSILIWCTGLWNAQASDNTSEPMSVTQYANFAASQSIGSLLPDASRLLLCGSPWQWTLGRYTLIQGNGNPHPTLDGYRWIASQIISLLQGGQPAPARADLGILPAAIASFTGGATALLQGETARLIFTASIANAKIPANRNNIPVAGIVHPISPGNGAIFTGYAWMKNANDSTPVQPVTLQLYGSGTIYLSNAQPVVTASPASDLQISVNTSIPLIPLL